MFKKKETKTFYKLDMKGFEKLRRSGALCLCIILAATVTSFAQPASDAFSKLSNVPLQSPQATSISRYVEFPVSYYNGQTQISIPVYEIKSGDISVPLTLSYHGGGIKVQEEASWVGLGWTLNAGGMITHDIKGEDDEYTAGPNNLYYPVKTNTVYNSDYDVVTLHGCSQDYLTPIYDVNGTQIANCDVLQQQLPLGGTPVDTEKDLYIYNFGSYSGKFINTGASFADLGRNNIIFIRTAGGFSAFTPDGFTYLFEKKETATSSTHIITTGYYLTQIKSPKAKVITFQYKTLKDLYAENGLNWYNYTGIDNVRNGGSEYIPQMPGISEQYGVSQYVSGESSGNPNNQIGYKKSFSQGFTCTPYLDKIVFDNGYITFSKSGRDDLYGVKLDEIRIYRSNNSLVKSIPFLYNYFTNTLRDDLYERANCPIAYPLQFRQNRLKLLSVTIDAYPHSFEYYEGDQYTMLPCKTSFSQDYWGFYNGKSNSSMIPDYNSYNLQIDIPRVLEEWIGADRNPDAAFGNAASLKKITYPTGGHTELVYEKNTFTNQVATQKANTAYVNTGGYSIGGPQVFQFTLTTAKYLDISGGLHCNGMGEDWNSSTYNCSCLCSNPPNANILYAMIEKVNPSTGAVLTTYPNWTFDFSKDAVRSANGTIDMKGQYFDVGTYRITVNYPVNHVPSGDLIANRRAELYVSYLDGTTSTSDPFGFGVGIRIKNIKNYDPVSKKTLSRSFAYEGGKMMHFPLFYWSTMMHYAPGMANATTGAYYKLYFLYNSPALPYSFSANGSFIGYDKVTESVSDGSIGKTEYLYRNTPDKFLRSAVTGSTGPIGEYIPGVPTTAAVDNGFLEKIKVYDKSTNLLKETISELQLGLTNTYWQLKYRVNSDGQNGDALSNLKFCFYPIQVAKLLTKKTTETEYTSGAAHATIKEYQYNNKAYPSEEKLLTSDGSALTSNYSYASDYTGVTSGWIKDLKDKNIVGIPLEVLSKRNGLVTSGTFTTYSVNGSLVTPNQVYRIETASPQNIASTAPNGILPSQLKPAGTLTYDGNGNLIQTQAVDNICTSYLWGYNNALPIAKAINAQNKDIFYTSFEDGTGNSGVGDAKAGLKSWTSTTSAPTYTKTLTNLSPVYYTLTYWIKSGGAWSQQTQSIASSQIVNGSYTINLNGQIDELKFYPANAQMTTYTYDPLVGMTSQADVNNRISTFEYDNLARLTIVRDQDGNAVKKFSFGYRESYNAGSSWMLTGQTRTYTEACSQSNAYTVTRTQFEEKDMAANSPTYLSTRWINVGTGTSPADWQTVGTYCEVINNQNTGNLVAVKRDLNPCSATYDQTQTTTTANTTACPLPRPCDATCGSTPSTRCINGVCETGVYGIISKQQFTDSGNNLHCTTIWGYRFSDGSTQSSTASYSDGPCN